MRHLHQELLAGLALDDPAPLSRRDRLHLRVCRYCAGELTALCAIVSTGRRGEPDDFLPPRPAVLTQIQAELSSEARPRPSVFVGSAADVEPARPTTRLRAPARNRTRVTAAIAAAALIGVSVGGFLWFRPSDRNNDEVVVARAVLQPLPEKSGQGTAELVRRDGVDQLAVTASTTATGPGFEELWLLNTDGRRMISLGVLPPDGRGSYPVPTTSGGLEGYTIVDISLEPFDGNAAHSSNSLLRGSLG